MRLSAYKKMIDSAMSLPEETQRQTINNIIKNARLDIGLFHGEFLELYEYKKHIMNNKKKIGQNSFPVKIWAEDKVGTNGIYCLDYPNYSDSVEYIRKDKINGGKIDE